MNLYSVLYICLNLKMCTNYESLVNFHIQGLEKFYCPLLRVLDQTRKNLDCSLRSGGATAATAAGIDDRLLKNMNVGRATRRKTVMLRNLLRTDYLFKKNWVFKCFLPAFDHSILIAQLIFPFLYNESFAVRCLAS